ncbi:hypothetical protein Nepgr_009293 [Nepenthes gracilis]|uniref:Uncharacterized protein n=1 Tax=Nepenthes gracilis TaxID=150966 RepID=A0AAD3XK09_NEPGR|nr:hypothetical protein Nepgr_009293 [Nepenthes gracilis]
MYGENYQRMELRMLMKKAAMEDLQKARVVVRVVVVQFGPRRCGRCLALHHALNESTIYSRPPWTVTSNLGDDDEDRRKGVAGRKAVAR